MLKSENNGMLLFEQWMKRGVKPNLNAIQRSWKGNRRGSSWSYANAFLGYQPIGLLVHLRIKLYEVTYSKSVVTAGAHNSATNLIFVRCRR